MTGSVPAAVAVLSTTGSGGWGLGPSLWFGIMLFLMVPFFFWLQTPQSMNSKHGLRNAALLYAAIGLALMVVIIHFTEDTRTPRPEKVVSAECQQIIDRHKAVTAHTQEEIHQYLKCEPSAGVGWMVWSLLGFVAVVSLAAVVMENRDTA